MTTYALVDTTGKGVIVSNDILDLFATIDLPDIHSIHLPIPWIIYRNTQPLHIEAQVMRWLQALHGFIPAKSASRLRMMISGITRSFRVHSPLSAFLYIQWALECYLDARAAMRDIERAEALPDSPDTYDDCRRLLLWYITGDYNDRADA